MLTGASEHFEERQKIENEAALRFLSYVTEYRDRGARPLPPGVDSELTDRNLLTPTEREQGCRTSYGVPAVNKSNCRNGTLTVWTVQFATSVMRPCE
jgi:predicted transcriptional regulator of viral defense system